MSINDEFDTTFTAKPIKSRDGFMVWIPKRDIEFLDIKSDEFLKIGIKKVKKK